MAERAATARKRRQTQAIIGAARRRWCSSVAGTVWLVISLGGDDDKQARRPPRRRPARPSARATRCPTRAAAAEIKDVGHAADRAVPPRAPQTHDHRHQPRPDHRQGRPVARCRARRPASPTWPSKKFFDNTKCHRLVTEGIKVLQCGDPSATGKGYRPTDGTGGPSYRSPRRTCRPTSARRTRRASSRWPTPGSRAAPAASSSSSTATSPAGPDVHGARHHHRGPGHRQGGGQGRRRRRVRPAGRRRPPEEGGRSSRT